MIKIASQNRLLNLGLAAVAALPMAVAGVFTSAGSAQAAALSGEFQFQGGFSFPGGTSLISLSSNSLTFTPQPITPIGLSSSTGGFAGFNTANIGNIISFSSSVADNPFIDFGNLTYPGAILPGDNTSSITDGVNTFSLTSANYGLKQSGANIAIDVALYGFFTSATGDISQGSGNLTFQINNRNLADVQTDLDDGISFRDLSFSGGAFTTVPPTTMQTIPEPATLLGLGLVGVGLAMSRRRKTVFQ